MNFLQVNWRINMFGMYGAATCGIIPYEGVNLFVCVNCPSKAKEYLRSYRKYCRYQKNL